MGGGGVNCTVDWIEKYLTISTTYEPDWIKISMQLMTQFTIFKITYPNWWLNWYLQQAQLFENEKNGKTVIKISQPMSQYSCYFSSVTEFIFFRKCLILKINLNRSNMDKSLWKEIFWPTFWMQVYSHCAESSGDAFQFGGVKVNAV